MPQKSEKPPRKRGSHGFFASFFVRFNGDFAQIAQKYFFRRITRLHH